MKTKNWNFLVYVHGVLLLWALLFIASIFVDDSGKTAGVLAIGNALFLFLNIPFAMFTLISKAKNRFSISYEGLAIVLSVINIIISVLAWISVVMLLQSPKFG